jgi:hypothetical protein
MSSSGESTHLKVVTVGDFDPQSDAAIEYDFIGRVIGGRYTIGKKIGGGGMADVFRATDEELGVSVAIKLLKPKLASDDLRARMVQEARAAAQVRHDNLVRVFGTGKLDSTAYIVMEMLAGPNLEEYVRTYRDQRIPWREALDLLLPALEALHAIHEQGYVHRDIKAGNILITRASGRPPTAIVIDLGLVKADRALRDAASPPTTAVGRLLCTPGYTSPEQAAGNPVDRRSDVYSMGVTLYRVLAGRLPFHEARGQPAFFVLTKHIYSEPTLLAEAGAGADIPPADRGDRRIRAAQEPEGSAQSMLEFAEALRAAAARVGPAPCHDGPGPSPSRAASPWAAPRVRPRSGAHQRGDPTSGVPGGSRRRASSCRGREFGGSEGVGSREAPDGSIATPALWSVPLALEVEPPADPGDASVWVSATDLPDGRAAGRRGAAGPSPVIRRRPSRSRVLGRSPAGRPAVQRCADEDTGGSDRLALAVNIDTTGRVVAHVVGAPESTLSRCHRQGPRAHAHGPAARAHVLRSYLQAAAEPPHDTDAATPCPPPCPRAGAEPPVAGGRRAATRRPCNSTMRASSRRGR